jgi:hypothetical protein
MNLCSLVKAKKLIKKGTVNYVAKNIGKKNS